MQRTSACSRGCRRWRPHGAPMQPVPPPRTSRLRSRCFTRSKNCSSRATLGSSAQGTAANERCRDRAHGNVLQAQTACSTGCHRVQRARHAQRRRISALCTPLAGPPGALPTSVRTLAQRRRRLAARLAVGARPLLRHAGAAAGAAPGAAQRRRVVRQEVGEFPQQVVVVAEKQRHLHSKRISAPSSLISTSFLLVHSFAH